LGNFNTLNGEISAEATNLGLKKLHWIFQAPKAGTKIDLKCFKLIILTKYSHSRAKMIARNSASFESHTNRGCKLSKHNASKQFYEESKERRVTCKKYIVTV
jgi:hypothetical protein